MPSISNLFHVAIKTNDLDATVRFYTEVLGLHKVARPDFGYPGAWLAAPGGAAIIHLYAGGPALGAEGRAPYGTAAMPTYRSPRPISMGSSRSSRNTAWTGANSTSGMPSCGNCSSTIRMASSSKSLSKPPRRADRSRT
jgi:catechol 2,3-dioxygenase-like lactoylglutathione lyase family enzyme